MRSHLLSKHASATVARSLIHGRQFLQHAVDGGIIRENPFLGVRASSRPNKDRLVFVNLEVAQKVLATCPSAEWRLIFALARSGGLRIPSEIARVKWSDILWSEKKIRVLSPKTEGIGKGERLLPMFPELVEPLRECLEGAKDGSVYVFEKKITDKTNLRKRLQGIIQKAGVVAWPRLFQNLRASRETELARLYSIDCVTAWMGNTQSVALSHYLQVTDADFEKAAKVSISGDMGGVVGTKDHSESVSLDAKMSQNPPHHGGSVVFADVQQLLENPEVMKNLAVIAEELKKNQVTSLGLEPRTPALKVPCSTS